MKKSLHAFFGIWLTVSVLYAQPISEATVPINFKALASNFAENGQDMSLSLDHIKVFNNREMLIAGALFSPIGVIRSVLLRSEDAGATWKEVMNPVEGSEVHGLHFFGQKGYLVTHWVVESSGEVVLFRTSNQGKTWQKVRNVPRPSQHEYGLYNFVFHSPTHFEVKYQYEDNRISYFSRNAGQTWQRDRRNILEMADIPPVSPTQNPRYDSIWGEIVHSETISPNWTLDETEKAYIFSKGNIRRAILRTYRYENGKVMPIR